MKYKDNLTDAKTYNRTKNPQSKTVACSDCGDTIPMNGETCVAFGVYACQTCRKGEKMEEKENRRRACALRRMSLAVDRVIRGENPEQAKKWANLWGRRAGLKTPEPSRRPKVQKPTKKPVPKN